MRYRLGAAWRAFRPILDGLTRTGRRGSSRMLLPVLLVIVGVATALPMGSASAQRIKEPPKPKPFKADLNVVVLRGLDKLTARISTFGGRVGTTVRFGTLEIVLRRCQRNKPRRPPERGAFLQIYEADPETGQRKKIFSGWMFASNPALNPLEHPIYDVWVKDCK